MEPKTLPQIVRLDAQPNRADYRGIATLALARWNRPNVKPRTKSARIPANDTPSSIDLSLLESLFDLAPDVAFFVKDAEGRYLLVNESLLRRHGLHRKDEAIGKRPCDICPGDFGRIPTEQDERVLRSGRPLIGHLELQWQRPREPVWCLTSKLPIRDASGAITGLIGFSQDVRTPLDTTDIPSEFAITIGELEHDPSVQMTPMLLARKSGMSPQRVARLTRRVFGLTPSQLITKTRLTVASGMLRDTARPVAEIALACGYSDQSAFTRAFRAATGHTPLEHRCQSLSSQSD